MSEKTAMEARKALDRDCMAVNLSVRQILSVIGEFIPRACIREAEDRLFDALFINGTELTSNLMRKEYEQWKKIELSSLSTMTSPPRAIP